MPFGAESSSPTQAESVAKAGRRRVNICTSEYVSLLSSYRLFSLLLVVNQFTFIQPKLATLATREVIAILASRSDYHDVFRRTVRVAVIQHDIRLSTRRQTRPSSARRKRSLSDPKGQRADVRKAGYGSPAERPSQSRRYRPDTSPGDLPNI